MENPVPNDDVIREYLLGRMDDTSESVEGIDELILTNADFSENVELVEDEIIEEYLEGELKPKDMEAVERHFLRPPERKLRLRNARLLNRHLETVSHGSAGDNPQLTVRRPLDFSARFPLLPRFRVCAEIAAAVVLTVSTVSLVYQRRDIQMEIRKSSQELAQERRRTAALNHQLEAALELADPPTAMLSLLEPGVRRGEAQLPELTVGTGTRNIHVEIVLPRAAPGAYRIQLYYAGKTVWSRDSIEALTAPDGVILMFDLPAQVLAQGELSFVVKHDSGAEVSYRFLVTKPQ
jgi:hypothetical protein